MKCCRLSSSQEFSGFGYVFYEFDYGVLWGSLVVFFTKQFGLCFSSMLFVFWVPFFLVFLFLKTWLVIWFGGVSGGGSLQIISCFYFGALLCSCFVWVLLLPFLLPKLFEVSGWVLRPCLMLWGIISCSIPSQEGVCVFFILFSYVYIFLPDSVFSCLVFPLSLCGRFLVRYSPCRLLRRDYRGPKIDGRTN